MTKKVKNKIVSVALLALALVLFACVSDLISSCYDAKGQQVPKWVFFSVMIIFYAVIGWVFRKFFDAFSVSGKKK
ncbi:hypothetical protein [Microbulbifer pacificus]|uniref:Lipoprotein n=1 Tax=Microbulbifer pacificus TaxID=407164 RepID=A0AAU0N0H9_9GAMM|nr:hypothetical protein [Microbulbifer pacificus]WOX06279.1 hypothetical protein R5R33_03905 [Microbulbifer pacificus]